MRRGSSTVIAVIGDVDTKMLARLGRRSNVSVLEPPGPGLEAASEALDRAGRLQTPYSLVAADPLADLAVEWLTMWSPGRTENRFEERAGEAIWAWRSGRLELPDYYLVVLTGAGSAGAELPSPHRYEFHLGVLRSERPSRVVEVVAAEPAEIAARILGFLPALRQGPWWPGLDVLVDAVRSCFPGTLATPADGGIPEEEGSVPVPSTTKRTG